MPAFYSDSPLQFKLQTSSEVNTSDDQGRNQAWAWGLKPPK